MGPVLPGSSGALEPFPTGRLPAGQGSRATKPGPLIHSPRQLWRVAALCKNLTVLRIKLSLQGPEASAPHQHPSILTLQQPEPRGLLSAQGSYQTHSGPRAFVGTGRAQLKPLREALLRHRLNQVLHGAPPGHQLTLPTVTQPGKIRITCTVSQCLEHKLPGPGPCRSGPPPAPAR